MKALGKDIYDFYINGWPDGYSHDTWEREIAFYPNESNTVGVYSLLEDDTEYDLSEFGTLWDDADDDIMSFERAYLSWKDIDKPEPMTFDRWLETLFPEPADTDTYSRDDLRLTWYAGIASVKEN